MAVLIPRYNPFEKNSLNASMAALESLYNRVGNAIEPISEGEITSSVSSILISWDATVTWRWMKLRANVRTDEITATPSQIALIANDDYNATRYLASWVIADASVTGQSNQEFGRLWAGDAGASGRGGIDLTLIPLSNMLYVTGEGIVSHSSGTFVFYRYGMAYTYGAVSSLRLIQRPGNEAAMFRANCSWQLWGVRL